MRYVNVILICLLSCTRLNNSYILKICRAKYIISTFFKCFSVSVLRSVQIGLFYLGISAYIASRAIYTPLKYHNL